LPAYHIVNKTWRTQRGSGRLPRRDGPGLPSRNGMKEIKYEGNEPVEEKLRHFMQIGRRTG